MPYDPFRRGPHPAGVRTVRARDAARERPLAIELWYPAGDAHAGQDTGPSTRDQYELVPGFPPFAQDAVRDAAPRAGRHPLIVFSHGYGSHRRQSTFLCTHLASHGYTVAAADHVGNTILDVMQAAIRAEARGEVPDLAEALTRSIETRPADVAFVLDRMIAELGPSVDPGCVAVAGHSFGGWTALAVTGRDRRIRAALALAPAGGGTAPTEPLARALRFDWDRDVPTLFVVAEQDSLLPLAGMCSLFERARGPKRLVVLRHIDHMHFCDRAEQVHEMFRSMPVVPELQRLAPAVPPFSELAAEASSERAIRGLALAHFDAVFRGDEDAARFLASDVTSALAAHGIAASAV